MVNKKIKKKQIDKKFWLVIVILRKKNYTYICLSWDLVHVGAKIDGLVNLTIVKQRNASIRTNH
jgi:hypothetical protein